MRARLGPPGREALSGRRGSILAVMRCARETGRAGSGWLRVAVSVATLIVAVLPWSAWGQAVDRLSVRMIGGRAVALVEVTHAGVTLPVQAVVDLGVRAPALLHERTAAALGIRGRAGAAVSVRFVADGVTWPSVTAVPVELEPLEELTRDHATELEDIPAAMVLGLPAFAGGVLDVDLAAGRLTLHGGEATLDGVLTASGVGRGNAGVTAMPFEAEAYGYWLDGQGPGGKRCRVRLSMGEGATRVNGDWAAGLGWPGGDLPSLSLGGLDLTQHAVLVPSDFSQLPAPLPDVSLGTRLLERFRLLVDAARGELVLVQTAEGPLDPRVRRYFAARVRGDADAVESFLQAGPPEAYAADAAEVLLAMRLDQSATVGDGAETGERGASEAEAQAALAAIDRAMGFMANWTAESARASRLIRVADDAIGLEGEHPLAFAVARLALARAQAGASADLDGTAAYHIQARLGLLALLEGRPDRGTASVAIGDVRAAARPVHQPLAGPAVRGFGTGAAGLVAICAQRDGGRAADRRDARPGPRVQRPDISSRVQRGRGAGPVGGAVGPDPHAATAGGGAGVGIGARSGGGQRVCLDVLCERG